MSAQLPRPAISKRQRQLRGIGAALAVYCAVAWLMPQATGLGFATGLEGRLIFGFDDQLLRVCVLISTVLLAGICTALATGDYVSGTGILANAMGLMMLGLCSGTRGGVLPGGEARLSEALVAELFCGLAAMLIAYTAAWQTELLWVLPKRPGPAYQKKIVGPRELWLINIPALIACGFLSLLFALPMLLLPAKTPLLASLIWFMASFGAASLVLRFLTVRSTFFIWTAPAAGILVALCVALSISNRPGQASLLPEIARLSARLPMFVLAPLGALAGSLAYLQARARRLGAAEAISSPPPLSS